MGNLGIVGDSEHDKNILHTILKELIKMRNIYAKSNKRRN